jgi:hypothetical protein
VTWPWIAALVAVAVLTVLNAVLLLALARYVGALVTRLPEPLALELSEGPELHTGLAEMPPDLTELLAGDDRDRRDLLLVFITTTCSACIALVDDLNRFARDRRDLRILAVVGGARPAVERMRAALRTEALLDPDGTIARAVRVDTVPFGLLYRQGQLATKGVVNSRDMLESLVSGRVRAHGDELLAAFAGSGEAAVPAESEDHPR